MVKVRMKDRSRDWRLGLKLRRQWVRRRSRRGSAGRRVGFRQVPTNLFIIFGLLFIFVNFISKPMNKTLFLLVLLAAAAYCDFTCRNCKPAIKIRNCNEPRCYRCGRNEIFNPDTLYCDCLPGFVPINGVCGKCQEGYEYDQVRQQCIGINPCGINQYIVNGVCKCLPGLIVIQNICQRCPTNQSYFPEYDACRCKTGFTLVNGSCIFIECRLNQVYSTKDQKCVCAFGYYLINGTCNQCKVNEVYDPANQSCSPFEAPECGIHEYFFENCCFCERGYVKIRGVCATCPKNSYYDWNTDSCVCAPGYYFVGEQVRQIPYQYFDTGSSFNNNPSNSYSYKGPYSGTPSSQPIIVIGSNYDASGINTNRPNINNVYNVPPINNRR